MELLFLRMCLDHISHRNAQDIRVLSYIFSQKKKRKKKKERKKDLLYRILLRSQHKFYHNLVLW